MTDRKNAMLTTEDRRWLTGEKSYAGEHAKQQRYQRRRGIRERVRNTVLDFTILFEHLEETEREKLFERLEDDEFAAGLRDGLAFILYNTGLTETMLEDGSERTESTAERLLREAVYEAGKRDEVLVEDVELSIDATRAPTASILEELKAGNEVSAAELCLLLESEAVDTDDARDCIRELVVDGE